VRHSIELFHLPTLMHNSLLINKCMLHYYPRHVSSINMPVYRCTVQPFTESDNTRCCANTICPPEDGHVNARNMSRIVV